MRLHVWRFLDGLDQLGEELWPHVLHKTAGHACNDFNELLAKSFLAVLMCHDEDLNEALLQKIAASIIDLVRRIVFLQHLTARIGRFGLLVGVFDVVVIVAKDFLDVVFELDRDNQLVILGHCLVAALREVLNEHGTNGSVQP